MLGKHSTSAIDPSQAESLKGLIAATSLDEVSDLHWPCIGGTSTSKYVISGISIKIQ